MLLLEAGPSERAIYLTYVLVSGRALTPQEAAEMTGVHLSTAYRILDRISRQVPLWRDEDGRWRVLEPAGDEISPF